MQNNLGKLVYGLFPDFTQFDAGCLLPYVQQTLTQNAQRVADVLAKEAAPTWDNFVAPL